MIPYCVCTVLILISFEALTCFDVDDLSLSSVFKELRPSSSTFKEISTESSSKNEDGLLKTTEQSLKDRTVTAEFKTSTNLIQSVLLTVSNASDVLDVPTSTERLQSKTSKKLNITTLKHNGGINSGKHKKLGPVAKARSGTYLGYWSSTSNGVRYASFSGIRYVKPMTPKNRFKWAEPVDDSKEEFNATQEGSDCPQWNIHAMSYNIVGKEDCLFMNIYTPRVNGKYPVMVVLPCGHFAFDSSSRYLNGPDYFMNTQEIVMVIFNYRLGPLGYSDFRSDKYPSNLGMKDQVLALKWIQRNIRAFGGDPSRVTLQGTSSGAVSVHLHMMSPLSKGLFHAGISESSTGLDPWSLAYPHKARKLLVSLASRVNCKWAVPALLDTSADLLAECFRNRTAYQLLAATRHIDFRLIQMLFLPVIEQTKDKPFLPTDPFVAPEYHVPWLSGQNSDETGIINSLRKPIYFLLRLYLSGISYEAIPYWLNYKETATDPWNVTTSLIYHYGQNFKPNLQNIITVFKKVGEDGIFWNPHYMSQLKHKGHQYSYLFSYRRTNNNGSFLHPNRGVTHSEEQFYLFIKQGVDIQANSPPRDANMSRTLVRLWVNFIKHYNPTPRGDKSLPKWEKWTAKNNLYYNIGQNSSRMIIDPKLNTYKFWKDLPYRDKMKPFPFYPLNITRNKEISSHSRRATSSSTKPFVLLPLTYVLISFILYL